MSAWVTLVGLGFRRWSTYRLAAFAGAFTNTVFGLIRAAVIGAAVGVAGGTLGGYDAMTGATYVWLGQALIGPIYFFAWTELAERIRTGDVAVDLARPVDPMLAYLAADLGRAAFVLLPRGLPPLLVGAVVTGLALPGTPLPYVLGLLSVVLAIGVSFACRWLVNLTAFWLLDLRGPMTLYLLLTGVMSGLAVPVHWFPPWLAAIAEVTPFPSMLQVPVDVLTGRLTGTAALLAVAVQAAWVGGLLGAGRLVFGIGTRKLVVQGG
ncbi:ABC-2 family transporter protein [Dactylosporangium fulvum]|uniref:ABC-2 family transporter protein n=1 Tax=Dactylosporangium fulvum TaxID=53359 RepID=A0ABY5VVL3_9ACTN|nr:ABC-2 family transporter protein [Dactylosporangium fulvum]UWP80851.1 ABC-2 family transporter protein [Dactylosporangium fulvum]